jgi:CelD/BcsL family acetyltransferase involved in cellulose biosynthesis
VTLTWINSLAGLEALRPRWCVLWDGCPRATPFQGPEWLIPWTRHLFGGGDIRCGVIEDDGHLIAIAPFFTYGTEERTLSFLGAGISDYGDLLALPRREHECAELIREWISQQPVRCDLREIPEHSALLAGSEQQCSVCPALELVNFEERLNPKLRHDLKRARNRLVKQHEYAFECGGEEYLYELFRLHESRWQQEEKPGVLNTAALQAFHREAASAFQQRGLLRIYVLKVDGEVRAVIYGFVAGTRFYSYLSGFDPAYGKISCGALLLRHAIEHAAAEGLLEFDFLREREAYKYLWGARDRTNYLLSGNTALGSGGVTGIVTADIAATIA